MLRDLVIANRTFRRFNADVAVSRETLVELVDLARHTASGMNRQPLKYILSNEAEKNELIFEQVSWAGALPDWPGPAEGERPPAYIIILLDKDIRDSPGADHGIAAQTIMLGAREKGLGGCMMGSAKKEPLQAALGIPEQYKILLVLALGEPAETVVLERIGEDGDFNYWRDANDVHRVPKRTLDEIILDL